jgi:hypothetical protein
MKQIPAYSKKHIGKWIAMPADKSKIYGYSENFSVLSKRYGTKNIVYTKVLDPSKNYAF